MLALLPFSVISYQLPVTSYQLPVISYQLPVISYQLPVTSYQLSGISYQFHPLGINLPIRLVGGFRGAFYLSHNY
ncbi:hypothetical protein [Anabaena sp. PCC 7108]|uniref:hypothetical protein n=1 Tax=Anabaena sp. PCC 7108 TaxID=163908 RepID=UPI0003492662|nr:hypothetical protein [Anabaena sp. PCC 7108]